MSRVKRGVTKLKHRKNVLAKAKGYRFKRGKKERLAHDAILHAGQNAFNDRRKKKGDFRRLFTIRLNAALRTHDISYSKFIGALKTKNILLNRKVLSEIAAEAPETFARIVESVKK